MDKEFEENIKKYPNGDLYEDYDYEFYVIEEACKEVKEYTGNKWSINFGTDSEIIAKKQLQFLNKKKDKRKRKIVIKQELKDYRLLPQWMGFWHWEESSILEN